MPHVAKARPRRAQRATLDLQFADLLEAWVHAEEGRIRAMREHKASLSPADRSFRAAICDRESRRAAAARQAFTEAVRLEAESRS